MVFRKLKDALSMKESEELGDEYLEIDLEQEKRENKVLVKLFVLKDYDDANSILNVLREGYTIAVIDIKVLRKKDPIELKRAISKIKKTIQALEGSIAGFGENLVIATPSFAKIDREVAKPKNKPELMKQNCQSIYIIGEI
jgi:SepF-like predicted cell division protein (DUF552 family)